MRGGREGFEGAGEGGAGGGGARCPWGGGHMIACGLRGVMKTASSIRRLMLPGSGRAQLGISADASASLMRLT